MSSADTRAWEGRGKVGGRRNGVVRECGSFGGLARGGGELQIHWPLGELAIRPNPNNVAGTDLSSLIGLGGALLIY